MTKQTGRRILFTMRCAQTLESDTCVCCQLHAEKMPAADGSLITSELADDDAPCDFCVQ